MAQSTIYYRIQVNLCMGRFQVGGRRRANCFIGRGSPGAGVMDRVKLTYSTSLFWLKIGAEVRIE